MIRTRFAITKMDCPSEEQLIRMKLEGIRHIESLEFDIPGRTLTVLHREAPDDILQKLDELKLNTSLVSSEKIDDADISTQNNEWERKLLWQVLGINVLFFVLELSTGIFSYSMGLVADSLDMLADSFVYALALYAVGSTQVKKKNIARLAGYFQLALAFVGLIEVVRRFLNVDQLPDFSMMIVISALSLAGNALCLYLLQKSKSREAHIQASTIFTSNDIIVNIGVIIAGALVYITSSKIPDLLIGCTVFALVANGAYRILRLSK